MILTQIDTMYETDWCIHAANIFYLASFLGRDMLWLRVLTCCGLIFGIVFFTTCQPAPMYGPTFWHIAFLIINFYQIHHLIGERRRLRLSREQEEASEMLDHLSDDELVDALTHAIYSDQDDLEIVTRDSERVLTPDEIALRDIAFRRLSRGELVNLLTRRMWASVKRLRPRWPGRKKPRSAKPRRLAHGSELASTFPADGR